MGQRNKMIVSIFSFCLGLTGCASGQISDVPIFVESSQERMEDTGQTMVEDLAPAERPASAGSSGSERDTGSTKEMTSIRESAEEAADTEFDFTICFAGDINLDENWCTPRFMDKQPNGKVIIMLQFACCHEGSEL